MHSAAITIWWQSIRLVIGEGASPCAEVEMPRWKCDAEKEEYRECYLRICECRVVVLQEPTVFKLLGRDDKSFEWVVRRSAARHSIVAAD
jgi:hypothetical protein